MDDSENRWKEVTNAMKYKMPEDLKKALNGVDIHNTKTYLTYDVLIGFSARHDDVETTEVLMDHGGLEGRHASLWLSRITTDSSIEMLEMILSKKEFPQENLNMALRLACDSGKIEQAEYLISKGSEVNDECFEKAVRSKSLPLVQKLVSLSNPKLRKIMKVAKDCNAVGIQDWCEIYMAKEKLEKKLKPKLNQTKRNKL